MADQTTAPLLDIFTTRDRPFIRIDGADYELRTSNDLTLEAYRAIERAAPRINTLIVKSGMSPAEESELSQLLDMVCRRALVAPDDLLGRLGDINRMVIFTAFTNLLTPSLLRTRATLAEASTAPGTKSSRGSRGSSAGNRKRGSRASRSASSAPTR